MTGRRKRVRSQEEGSGKRCQVDFAKQWKCNLTPDTFYPFTYAKEVHFDPSSTVHSPKFRWRNEL